MLKDKGYFRDEYSHKDVKWIQTAYLLNNSNVS